MATGRSDRKRAAILSAASGVFLRDGFRGANMDVVAAASGVSKQTVYAHFGSKEELYVQTVAEMTERVAAQLPAPPPSEINRHDAGEWLLDYAVRQLAAVLQPQVMQLRRLVIAEAERFPAVARAFHDHGVGRSLTFLAAALDGFVARGLLHIDDVHRASLDFNWLLMGEPINQAMMLGLTPTAESARTDAAHAVSVFLAANR